MSSSRCGGRQGESKSDVWRGEGGGDGESQIFVDVLLMIELKRRKVKAKKAFHYVSLTGFMSFRLILILV